MPAKQKASVASWGSPSTVQQELKFEENAPRSNTSMDHHKASIFSWNSDCSSAGNNDSIEEAFEVMMIQKRSKLNNEISTKNEMEQQREVQSTVFFVGSEKE